jgi:hypothetical protein
MALDTLNDTDRFDSTAAGRERLLGIKARTTMLDPLVTRALAQVQKEFLRLPVPGRRRRGEDQDSADSSHDKGEQGQRAAGPRERADANTHELLGFVRRRGIGAQLLKLTAMLNKSALDETSRALLATPGVYDWILLKLLKSDQAEAKDVEGLRLAVQVEVKDSPRVRFVEFLLAAFADASKLDLDPHFRERMSGVIVSKGVPLTVGRVVPALRSIFEGVRSEGNLREFVDAFALRGEIEESRFTPSVRRSMVNSLEGLGLRVLESQKFDRGDYDEYFAQVYQHATVRNAAGISVETQVRPAEDEFQLPLHGELNEQGVVPDSIHAAAVLYQICVIGDQLGMLEMPNALLARRARGRLDLPSGEASSLLQAYKRFQRSEDVQPEERWLLHKRVLGMGSGKVLEDTVTNEEFGSLWDALMTEIGGYITRDESNSSDREERVSRDAILEAIGNLQYNLSFHASDIDEDVRVMMRQYALAQQILEHQQITAALGLVRRQTLQAAIEKILSNDGGPMLAVRNMFSKGTAGQEILHLVAKSTLSEDEFQALLSLGRRWIIATGALPAEDDVDEEADQEDADLEMDDDDDDWA